MISVPLSDNDHISRYCKPSTVEHGIPMPAAFLPRPNEEYLSVNWLEYFSEPTLDAAVDEVRRVFSQKGYRIVPNGRFAVLNIGAVKTASLDNVGRILSIDHLPLSNDQSHAGLLGYTSDDLAVAIELAALVTQQDIYPATT